MRFIKLRAMIAGLSLVVVICGAHMLWVYYTILKDGKITLAEPNTAVLIAETTFIGLMVLSAGILGIGALIDIMKNKMEVILMPGNQNTKQGINLVHIGFHNYLATDRVVTIATPGAAPIKRKIQDARDKDLVIDLTNGRRTKAVIFTDCNYIVLAALEPVTLNLRMEGG